MFMSCYHVHDGIIVLNTVLQLQSTPSQAWLKKTAVKGVIYNPKKHIRDLQICGGIGGGVNAGAVLEVGGQRRGDIGGTTV